MKKILSFISIIVLTLCMGVFFASCGDKYKKMYLEVQYYRWTSIDENGNALGEWRKIITDPEEEGYGLSVDLNDSYKSAEGDFYELRLRVLVKGTKKSVGEIYVSAQESELTKRTVKNKEEFKIKFSSTSSPYLFVTPSVKAEREKVDFPIVFYSELESITLTPNYTPAVVKGSDLNLQQLSDLIIYNGVGGIPTNQKGVAYSLSGVGVEFEDGVYTSKDKKVKLYTKNNENVLHVDSNYAGSAVKIIAKSVYYDYIARDDKSGLQKEIDVKTVENVYDYDINLNFKNKYKSDNDEANNSSEVKEVTLYPNLENYNHLDMVLSVADFDKKVYNFENNYEVAIYIYDNNLKAYKNMANENYEYNGVRVVEDAEDNSSKHKTYNIELLPQTEILDNKLMFVVGFKNYKFTGKDYSLAGKVLNYVLNIKRADVPSSIKIGDVAYRDGQTMQGVVFDSYERPYGSTELEGLQLDISAIRGSGVPTEIGLEFEYTTADPAHKDTCRKLNAYYHNGLSAGNSLKDETSYKVYFMFEKEGSSIYPTNVNVKLKVLVSPSEFAGDSVEVDKRYLTVTLSLAVSGSVKSVSSLGVENTNNNLFGTENVKYINSEEKYFTKLSFESKSNAVNVNSSTLTLSSLKNNVEFSADGKAGSWVKSINCATNGLYIRGDKNTEAKLLVTSDNGARFESTTIKFVETTGENFPSISWNNTSVLNALKEYNGNDFEANYYTDGSNDYEGYYLTMPVGQETDFVLKHSNGSKGVFNVSAKPLSVSEKADLGKTFVQYSVDCVKIHPYANDYSFNLRALTSDMTVIKLTYSYYKGRVDNIEIKTKTIYIELAVYNPVTSLELTFEKDTDNSPKNEIYYVNKFITDKASTSISVKTNDNATKNIYFTNDSLKAFINSDANNGTGYIYNIKVHLSSTPYIRNSDWEIAGRMSGLNYLDLITSNLSVKLLKDVLSDAGVEEGNINITFTVETLNGKFSYVDATGITITKHVASEGIKIEDTYSGNVYLSLISEQTKTTSFKAKVSNLNATYKELEYELYDFNNNNVDDHFKGDRAYNADLQVEIREEKVYLTARENGGKYILRLVAVDSYSDTKSDFTVDKYIVVTVSDGTQSSPYYLKNIDDVKLIRETANNDSSKYFVLANDIDLSQLDGPIVTEFKANLNGAIEFFDAESMTVYYSQYSFKQINLSNLNSTINNDEMVGLFGVNKGVLQNVVLTGVNFNYELAQGNNNTVKHIGGLAGINEGTIINCSATIGSASISLTKAGYQSVNVGGLVATNKGEIHFYDSGYNSTKKYTNVLQTVEFYGTVTVNVTTNVPNTILNVGGIVGENTATIMGNYYEVNDKLFADYLTAEVKYILNIDPEAEFMSANVGGVAGLNTGSVQQVCVTGDLRANGSGIALGGLVGKNEATLTNSATYTTNLVGANYTGQNKITGQFVGGVAGVSSGTISCVDAIFINLANTGYETNLDAKISGVCVVGGIVGNLTGSTSYIENANVQSFFNEAVIEGNFKNNSDDGTSKILGGIVGYKTGGEIYQSFVKANIYADSPKKLYTIAEGDFDNVYFIGRVDIKDKALNDSSLTDIFYTNNSADAYSLVFGYVHEGEGYGKLFHDGSVKGNYSTVSGHKGWLEGTITEGTSISSMSLGSAPIISVAGTEFSNDTDYTEQNYGLPVMTYGGKPTLIALPEQLQANVLDKEFGGVEPEPGTEPGPDDTVVFKNNNGVFISKGEYNSAIVFLDTNKKYNLVDSEHESGLIEKKVLPVIASGQYVVNVVSGDCILNGNTIQFTKPGRIVLDFISLFNTEARDRVVIYVEEGVNGLQLSNSSKVFNNASTLSLPTNTNTNLNLTALFDGNLSKIDTNNLFVAIYGDSDVTLKSLGESKKLNYYTFADINLKVGNIDSAEGNRRVNIDLYLDLSKYLWGYDEITKDPISYEDIFGEAEVNVGSAELGLKIYQSATKLNIENPEQVISTSKDSYFVFDILSKYVTADTTNYTFTKNGNLLASNDTLGREFFTVELSSANEEYWFDNYSISSLWDLIDYSYNYEKLAGNEGYNFTFFYELKEQYRNIVKNEVFNFKFISTTNAQVHGTATVTYTPQPVTKLRIENFKSGVVSIKDNQVEYRSNETNSSFVVPGKNGLIKIFVEPKYANVDLVVIHSDTVMFNGLPYTIKFQQMLYDEAQGFYVSYPGYTTENDSLRLQKNSYIDSSGNKQYNGVIYVRTILEDMKGATETFTITVNTLCYQRDENGDILEGYPIDQSKTVPQTKFLDTMYNPGVSLTVENLAIGEKPGADPNTTEEVYLIEETSNNAVVYANIIGYHLNQRPDLVFEWVDSHTENVYDYVNYAIDGATDNEDGSYKVPIYLTTNNLPYPIKMKLSLSLMSDGVLNKSEESVLIFYPVKYIPNSVYLKYSGNNYIAVDVNSSIYLDFVWQSVSQQLNSDDINSVLFDQDETSLDILDFVYANSYSASGQKEEKWLEIGEYETYSIVADRNAKKYVINALGEGQLELTFKLRYSYEYVDSRFEIRYYSPRITNQGANTLTYNFIVKFNVTTTEETAEPIWTAEQFVSKMTAGGNYILMADITLVDWTPVDANFASLDGNGYRIILNNFAFNMTAVMNAGLFATVSENTILKNIIVDIGKLPNNIYLDDGSIITGDTTFGFIAGINEGIIYNSEVICSYQNREITINVVSNKSNIGLFVGENRGIITNSRVGTPYYEIIKIDSDGFVTTEVKPTYMFNITSSGIMGGFVGVNSGIISSSYFNNANIINTKVGTNDINMTAGFVANNGTNGRISGSYAKGEGITSTNVRGTESGVYNLGNGASAGFVFNNSGLVENSYSNLAVVSNSYVSSGFVYSNNNGATIQQSYSASMVKSNKVGSSLAVELPFIAVNDLNVLQSYGTLENCYYLDMYDNYDKSYEYTSSMDLPRSMNLTNFGEGENLENFAFVPGNYTQSIQGIWTYYANLDERDEQTSSLGKTQLPELTSANQPARSLRYVVESVNEEGETEHTLVYAKGYNQGTEINPYIIRDYQEYNKVFNYNENNTQYNNFTGHVRLINDIDFRLQSGETSTISTTLGYVLGDKNLQTITVLDGNGMSISGVDTKNNEVTERKSLGLFNTISYAIVKNLDINFESMNYTSTRATYSGGLAATINDSFIIGLELNGQNTTISASNFAGGVAGIITGNSGIYNVTSNLSAKVGKENKYRYYQYITEERFNEVYSSLGYVFTSTDLNGDGKHDVKDKYLEYLTQLSYAGGLAGVIDIDNNGKDVVNVNKISIGYGTNVSVVADIAGFVAGHTSRDTSANRLKGFINTNSYVEGSYIVGGMVAEHYGKIRYSQLTFEDNYAYDKAFGDYLVENTPTALDKVSGQFGNLSFVRAGTGIKDYNSVAGGFVGVNYGGLVYNSYTKANISANVHYIGGFAGVTYGGVINTVYAQNYIELEQTNDETTNRTKYVGGFVAYNSKKSESDSYAKIYDLTGLVETHETFKTDSVVIATFIDKSWIKRHYDALKIVADEVDEELTESAVSVKLDYLLAISNSKIKSSQGTNTPYNMYYLQYAYNEDDTDYIENSYLYYPDVYTNIGIEGVTTAKDIEDNQNIWKGIISRGAEGGSNLDIKDAEGENIKHLYDLTYDKQSSLYTEMFLSFNERIWDKEDKTKYFPLLNDNPYTDAIEIYTEQDLQLIILYPDADFVLMNDITLSGERDDFVLDVEFTGSLTGMLDEDGDAPAIRGIKIKSHQADNAGFFRQTGSSSGKGATITNIVFEYDYFNSADDSKDEYVGLISAKDYYSTITGVQVIATKVVPVTVNSNTVNQGKSTIFTQGGEIKYFGGFFGFAQCTEIIISSANVDAYLKCSGDGGVEASFGGLIGEAQGTGITEPSQPIDIINSNFYGKLILTNYDNVGGIAGSITDGNVIGGITDFELSNTNNAASYIGGVVGVSENSYVEDTNSGISINKLNSTTASYLGGVAGSIATAGTDTVSCDSVKAKLIFNMEDADNSLIIGGIYATNTNKVTINQSIAWIYGTACANSITFGGLVALTAGELIATDSFAYMEAKDNATGLKLKSATITAGGLAGEISAGASFSRCSSSGAIWPVSSSDITLTFGGLVGQWKAGTTNELSNCYTSLMLESSEAKIGPSANYKTSAIVGKSETTINASEVLYSSDFTLCTEEKELGDVINIVSTAMLLADHKKQFFNQNIWITTGGGLPYNKQLADELQEIGLLERYTSSNGFSLNPKRLSIESPSLVTDKYLYYYVNAGDTFKLSGNFEGVLLGGSGTNSDGTQATVNYEKTGALDLEAHSVISNLKITIAERDIHTLVGGTQNFSFVNVNNGTISNLYIDYYFKGGQITTGGGIVKVNNGTMLYCFNSGALEEMVNPNIAFAGIATENHGYIAHSAFIGTITSSTYNNGNIAGFCYTNTGTIYNCYSAGVISTQKTEGVLTHATFVKSNSGTLENCYYDQHANVEFGKIEGQLTPVSTEALQKKKDGEDCSDKMGENWLVYTYQRAIDENENEIIEESEFKDQGYNYGYPIYQVKQKAYHTGTKTVVDFKFKGLATGNGSSGTPYLINHLGILKQVDTNGLSQKGVSFKLVNDLDGDKSGNLAKGADGNYLYYKNVEYVVGNVIANWSGISNFSASFVSGNRVATGTDDGSTLRFIKNITGTTGLFNSITAGANIQRIAIGNMTLSNSGLSGVGALANSIYTGVVEADKDNENITINNIYLGIDSDASKLTQLSLSGTNVGALIGSIYGSRGSDLTISIKNINKLDVVDPHIYSYDTIEEATYNLYSTSASNSLGSVIGSASVSSGGEKIEINLENVGFSMDSIIGADKSQENINANDVGGIVGTLGLNTVLNLKNVTIIAGKAEGGTILGINNVGGIAGKIEGGILNIDLGTVEDDLTLSLGVKDKSSKNAKTTGGIVGLLTGSEDGKGLLNIVNPKTAEASIIIKQIVARENVGGLIGSMEGGIAQTILPEGADEDDYNLKTNVKVQFLQGLEGGACAGGLVGSMVNRSLSAGASEFSQIGGFTTEVNLSGDKCKAEYFGGVVGKVSGAIIGFKGGPSADYEPDSEPEIGAAAVASETEFGIEIKGNVELTNSNYAGGVAGLVTGGDIQSTKFNIVNNNMHITIKDTGAGADTGLGGIAGLVSADSLLELGKITMSANKLIAKGKASAFKNIGGLFGLLCADSITSTETLNITGLELSGFENVGGFAGKFYNTSKTLSINEKLAEVLNTEFATIKLPTELDEDITITKAQNYGGLFGLYEGDSMPEISLTNKNDVLYYEEVGTDYKRYTLGAEEGKGIEIVNVGGIAGKINCLGEFTLKGSNEAFVGSGYENGKEGSEEQKYSALKDSDLISSETKLKIFNIQDVGGIAGSINIKGKAGSEGVDPVSASINVNGVSNTGTINGYNYVGGIVGRFNNCPVTVSNATLNGTIYGYSYLGGLAGEVTSLLSWSDGNAGYLGATEVAGATSGLTISGYSYIGGVIGEISVPSGNTESNKIGGMTIGEVNINGLINIGGVVGAVSNNSSVDFKVVGLASTNGDTSYSSAKINIAGNANVGGVVGVTNKVALSNYHNLPVNIDLIEYNIGADTAVSKTEDVYFSPVSVGGIIGKATDTIYSGVSTSGDINTLEHETELDANNYFAIAPEGKDEYPTGSYSGAGVYESNFEEYFVSYASLKLGIGGVVGTSLGTSPLSEFLPITNFSSKMNIYAPYSANVGGLIGYCYTEGNRVSLQRGDTKEVVKYIAGGMSVGSLIGYLDNNSVIAFEPVGTDTIGNQGVFLQRNYKDSSAVEGKYIGGYFGRANSFSGITIDNGAHITIDNTLSEHCGGIVGWLEGSMKNVENNCLASDGLFEDESLYNYGGLVGLVNVDKNYGEEGLIVQGTHNFAFTVGKLQIEYNGETFKSTQNFALDSENVFLINNLALNQLITISPGSLDSDADGVEDIDYNPIRYGLNMDGGIKTYGWDKEYSMFRYIDYVYASGNVVETTQTVYDAKFVTEVAHGSDGTIKYTIYDTGDNPIMYTKYGIATEFMTNIVSYNSVNGELHIHNALLIKLAEEYGLTDDELWDLFKGGDGVWPYIFNHIVFNDYTPVDATISGTYPNTYWQILALDSLYDKLTSKLHNSIYNYNTFYNFRSDEVVRKALASNKYEDLKKLGMQLDLYFVKSSNISGEGIYPYSYFKYDTIYAKYESEEYDKESDFAYSYYYASTGSLFDINQTSNTFVNDASWTTGWWLWKKDHSLNLSNYLNSSDLKGENDTLLSYLLNLYNGQFGFIGDVYTRDSYFSNYKLQVTTDKVRDFAVEISGGAKQSVYYHYYSTERPDDYESSISIDVKSVNYPRYTEYIPEVGDSMPKYVYDSGEYYICCYALDTIETRYYPEKLPQPTAFSGPYYIQLPDGTIYIYPFYRTGMSDGPDKEYKDYLKEDSSLSIELGFEFVSGYKPTETDINGFDYIQKTASDVNWKLVTNAEAESYGEHAIEMYKYLDGKFYYSNSGHPTLYDQSHKLVPTLEDATATSNISIDRSEGISIGLDGQAYTVYYYYYGMNEGDVFEFSQLIDEDALGAQKTYFHDEIEKMSNLNFKYAGYKVEYIDKNGESQEINTIPTGALTVPHTYNELITGEKVWVDEANIDTDKRAWLLMEKEDGATTYGINIYDESGNATDLINIDSSNIGNYYCDASKKTRLTTFYRFEDGRMYRWMPGYYAKSVGRIYKLELKNPDSDYYNNKTSFNIITNGKTYKIYTRYKFDTIALRDSNTTDWNTFIASLPSEGNGYCTPYNKFNEVAMFTFRTRDGDGKVTGGIQMYTTPTS